VSRAGILLDAGPIVALLSMDDAQHQRAKRIFSECVPPFRCCEAVVAEACFLMRKIHSGGPAEVIALGRKGIYEVSINVAENWESLETLLRKYRNRPTFSQMFA
jgi:predicted nucleic acid-binding protein